MPSFSDDSNIFLPDYASVHPAGRRNPSYSRLTQVQCQRGLSLEKNLCDTWPSEYQPVSGLAFCVFYRLCVQDFLQSWCIVHGRPAWVWFLFINNNSYTTVVMCSTYLHNAVVWQMASHISESFLSASRFSFVRETIPLFFSFVNSNFLANCQDYLNIRLFLYYLNNIAFIFLWYEPLRTIILHILPSFLSGFTDPVIFLWK